MIGFAEALLGLISEAAKNFHATGAGCAFAMTPYHHLIPYSHRPAALVADIGTTRNQQLTIAVANSVEIASLSGNNAVDILCA